MGEVEVGGARLYWTEAGVGEPVVFVHGIPTDWRAWVAQMDALSAEFRTVSYSRRYAYPNARNGDVSDSTVENNAADLAGLIASRGLGPVHLVGHSFGGFVAAYLAADRPRLVRTLTLVEPAIVPLLLAHPRSRWDAFRLLLRRPRVALSAARFLRNYDAPALAALGRGELAAAVGFAVDGVEDRPGALARMPEEIRTMMLANARTIRETDTPFPPFGRARLASVKRPTLVVSGQTGALWLRTIARLTARAVPGAEFFEVEGAGHFPHLQRPDAFSERLLAFLRAHAAGRPK